MSKKRLIPFLFCTVILSTACSTAEPNHSIPETTQAAVQTETMAPEPETTQPETTSVPETTAIPETTAVPETDAPTEAGTEAAEEPTIGYTDDELCEMALDYYEAKEGYRPSIAEVAQIEEDTALIQLFDIVDDHTATSEWYNVNRVTAAGTNLSGETIDLKQKPSRGYSDEELCQMALDYYEVLYDYRPSMAAAGEAEDGMVVIQLYDNLGTHNSTSAWYTVDRITAVGTDTMDRTIDLKEVLPTE